MAAVGRAQLFVDSEKAECIKFSDNSMVTGENKYQQAYTGRNGADY